MLLLNEKLNADQSVSRELKARRLSTYMSHPEAIRNLIKSMGLLRDVGWEIEMVIQEVKEIWEVV